MKKSEGGAALELVRTPDILRALGQSKAGRFLVGFAAETDHIFENARKKLAEKNLDLIVANDIAGEGSGFGSEANAGILLDARGTATEIPRTSKREMAERIWDRVIALRATPAATVAADGPRRA
jgi:phosphopantothenoylcysteine decarboxylase/phosphopantothenate--cysteine ligase